MKSVLIERPTDWDCARVYPLSDLHLGDAYCDLSAIKSQIHRIADDRRALVLVNGDVMNTATRASVSDVYGETLKPSEQLELACGLLAPIADKIIGITCGNHEARIYRADGIDTCRLMARELGKESLYNPDGLLVFLRFGLGQKHGGRAQSRQTYSIYMTHGAGNGRREGGKINRLADLAGIVDADIYVHSHTHLPAYFCEDFYRVDVQNAKAVQVCKGFLNTSAALKYGGYGESNSFKPSSVRFPVLELRGDRHEFSVTI